MVGVNISVAGAAGVGAAGNVAVVTNTTTASVGAGADIEATGNLAVIQAAQAGQVPFGDDAAIRRHKALAGVDLPAQLGASGNAGALVTGGGIWLSVALGYLLLNIAGGGFGPVPLVA